MTNVVQGDGATINLTPSPSLEEVRRSAMEKGIALAAFDRMEQVLNDEGLSAEEKVDRFQEEVKRYFKLEREIKEAPVTGPAKLELRARALKRLYEGELDTAEQMRDLLYLDPEAQGSPRALGAPKALRAVPGN